MTLSRSKVVATIRVRIAHWRPECYKKGPKCEDDERKGKRDDGVEHRLRTGEASCEPLPSEPSVKCARQ